MCDLGVGGVCTKFFVPSAIMSFCNISGAVILFYEKKEKKNHFPFADFADFLDFGLTESVFFICFDC